MQKFKRAVSYLLCVLIIACGICSCSQPENKEAVSVLAEQAKKQLEPDIVWTQLPADKVAVYFGFSGETAKDCAVFINDSDEHFYTVAFFDFENEQDKKSAINSLNEALTKAVSNYKTVKNDSEAEKIQKRLVYESGNKLCVIITALPENATQFLTEKNFTQVK